MVRLYHRYQLVACAAALVSMLTFAYATADAFIALLAVPTSVASLLLFRNNTLSPVPRWVINALLALATLSLFRVLYAPPEQVIAILGQFLVWLLVIKFFENHNPRNQAPSIVLSLLLVVAAVLSDVTLDIGLLLLLYAPLALAWAVLFQLYSAAHRAHAATHAAAWSTDDTQREPFPLELPPNALQQSRRIIFLGALGSVACAVVVFILMPRNIGQGALAQWPEPTGQAQTGLTNDYIRLGQETNIRESDEQVLTASVRRLQTIGDRNNRVVVAPRQTSGPFLLRAIVLDRYRPREGRWERSELMAENTQNFANATPVTTGTAYANTTRPSQLADTADAAFEITIKPLRPARSEILTLWMPLAIDDKATPRRDFTMNPFDALTELQGRDRRRSLNPYAVIALQNPSLGLNPPPGQPPKEALQNWYRTPALHANPFANHPDLQPVRQLAQEVLDNADITTEPDDTWFARLGMPDLAAERTPPPRDITAIARAFETHLERNFLYTLDLQPADPSLDPIVDFITNTQRGHCEYFASALAGLLRAANINARVVLGYVATEYDPVEEAFVVRERHAHAWVEAETAPGVWRTFDPSPRASTQQVHTPEPTLFDGVRRWFDRAETLWIRSVVSFDQDNQAAIFGMQQDGSFEPPDWIASLFDGDATADEQSGALTTLTRSAFTILLTVLVVAAATIAVYAASKRTAALIATLRARREQHADNPIPDPPFYTETLRALRDAQLTKPDATPPRAHADRIAPANPDAARLLKRIADLYYTARFAQRPLSPEQQQHATTLLTQLRQTLNPPESPRTDHASTA